ncbi:Uncharacterised protein [Halioglobus japonicus]|nr:Uncharacterised protein [Halioglobus japonicus]
MLWGVGIIIGLVLGLTGAGGSVFAVPLLIWIVGLEPSQAIGISLGVVAIAALFGVITRLRSGEIQWLPALVYATLGSIVAPVGQWLNQRIDDQWLMAGFGFLVLIIALRLWLQASRSPQETRAVRASVSAGKDDAGAVCRMINNQPFRIGLPCAAGMSGGAILTGILSGLFGVGGGFIIVPTLLFLTRISIRQAVATSLVVISAVGISGFSSFLLGGGNPGTGILLQVAAGSIVGMTAGVFCSRFLSGPVLQKVFAVMMLAIGGITVYTQVL